MGYGGGSGGGSGSGGSGGSSGSGYRRVGEDRTANLKVNNITSRDGKKGTDVDGIVEVNTTAHFVPPSGVTGSRFVYNGPDIVTDGLVLHLDAKYGYDGGYLRDLTGNGGDVELIDNHSGTFPRYENTGGGSIFFSGGSGADIGIGPTGQDIICPSTDLTFSQWLYRTTSDTTIRDSINFRSSADETYFILFRGDQDPKEWQFGYRTTTDDYVEPRIDGKFLDLETWYNFTFVIDSKTQTANIYANGVLQTKIDHNEFEVKSFGTNIITRNIHRAKLNIGGDIQIAARRWLGNIGPTTIYNKALSAEEVLFNYDALKSRFGY